jgi:hypothetical protein
MRHSLSTIITACVLGASGTASAGTVTSFTASPTTANVNQQIAFTVAKTGSDCGFELAYGDGAKDHKGTAGFYNVSLTAKAKPNKAACGGRFPKTIKVTINGESSGGPKVGLKARGSAAPMAMTKGVSKKMTPKKPTGFLPPKWGLRCARHSGASSRSVSKHRPTASGSTSARRLRPKWVYSQV